MNTELLLLPNYADAVATILEKVGADDLWSHYPSLRAVHEQIDAEVTEDVAGPGRRRLAIELFRAIRTDFPEQPGLYDRLLIKAARLDLHHSRLPDAYLDADGEVARVPALLDAIGNRMNLPFETANYLCHLSNERKYLYVATPKVACTLIKHCLQQAEMDSSIVYRQYGEEHLPVLSPLLSPIDNPVHFLEATGPEPWFRFTFVRDPFNRALSCYLDKVINAKTERSRLLPQLGFDPTVEVPSFGDFLRAIERQPEAERDIHWAAQSWLTGFGTMKYDFIGHLERFADDFHHLCERLAIERPQYPSRHATHAEEKLAAYYGPEEIELVQTIYARDFEDFEYDPSRLSTLAVGKVGDN